MRNSSLPIRRFAAESSPEFSLPCSVEHSTHPSLDPSCHNVCSINTSIVLLFYYLTPDFIFSVNLCCVIMLLGGCCLLLSTCFSFLFIYFPVVKIVDGSVISGWRNRVVVVVGGCCTTPTRVLQARWKKHKNSNDEIQK